MMGMITILLVYSPHFEVATASCEEVVVGMPVDAEDGGTNRLFDVLTHPPESEGKINLLPLCPPPSPPPPLLSLSLSLSL